MPPIDSNLLNILCCPETKVALQCLDSSSLDILNKAILEGQVKNIGGQILKENFVEALITTDGQRIYQVKEGIPVLLIDEGIQGDVLSSP